MRFIDTNVLLYAVSTTPDEAPKRDTARGVLDADDLALSVQVLHEFYVQATRTSRPDPLQHEQAANLIEAWKRFPVQDITLSILDHALATRLRFSLSYWDSAIVESARHLGCTTILSEDMQDGMDFGGIRIQNPFR